MRTLYIGNSHTYFNDMPKIFADICRENGVDMQVTMLTQGGMGLDYHADNSDIRRFIEVFLKELLFDVVLLYEYSKAEDRLQFYEHRFFSKSIEFSKGTS